MEQEGATIDIQGRLLEMLGAFARTESNAIQPEDMVRQQDGGLMDEDEMLAFLDEVEGEFGITLHQPEQEAIATVEDLMDYLSALIAERLIADEDMV